MMIDTTEREFLMDFANMSADDVKTILEIEEIRKESERLYNAVIKNQKVGLSDKFILWDDSNNREYLERTDCGWKWVAAYLHQHYEVFIDKNSIFNMMRDAYLFAKDNKNSCRTNTNGDAIKYFKSYVNRLENGITR